MNKCTNCGRPYKPLRRSLCQACAVYQRRFGKPRPYVVDGRKEGGGLRGADHPCWKGDAANTTTKRARARRMYAATICETCGASPAERHHIDGNTGNNQVTNIQILCRRCHMEIDGRLAIFVSHRVDNRAPPKPCTNCRRPSKPLRRGLCKACYEYERRNDRPRPYVEDGRSERFV